MINRYGYLLLALGCWLLLAATQVSFADDKQQVTLGYLSWSDDPRYTDARYLARLPAQPWGRPLDGAKLALRDARFAGDAVGVKYKLLDEGVDELSEVPAALGKLADAGAQFILLDLPAEGVRAATAASEGRELLLFNVSALDDELRNAHCAANLLHTAPSQRMLMDALGQYLVSKKWRELLVLDGTQPQDKPLIAAFDEAVKRYKFKIEERREFVLGNDPRQRGRNNVSLLTKGDYEVAVVLDADGEFAREVPYQTLEPRPVVGSAGLVPDWWHWGWTRNGAPQLNKRFIKRAKRHMTGYDWSAWAATKSVVEASLRVRGNDFAQLRDFLLGDELVVDGFKGGRMSYRAWNGQLRQPVFLTSGNWVTARAPLEGFLHATNDLDTLGANERDHQCKR
jgi:ABC transporter substrate binding protein (PQQ-dependent alcohol dehydrogenase system)